MRQILFFTLFIIACVPAIAQISSISQVENFFRYPLKQNISNLLLKSGWAYSNSINHENGVVESTYSYNEGDEGKAEAWFTVLSYDNRAEKVVFTTYNKSVYVKLKNDLELHRYNISSVNILDDKLVEVFQKDNFKIDITLTNFESKDDFDQSKNVKVYKFESIRYSGQFDTLNGKRITYYDNGTLHQKYEIKNGKVNGKLFSYFQDSTLEAIISFKNGNKEGLSKFYDPEEETITIAEYKNDMLNGSVKTYHMDKLVSEKYYVEDKLTSSKNIFYDDKNKIIEKQYSYYKNQLRNGNWRTILPQQVNDSVYTSTIYNRGVKIGKSKEIFEVDSVQISDSSYYYPFKYPGKYYVTCNYKDGEFDGPFNSWSIITAYTALSSDSTTKESEEDYGAMKPVIFQQKSSEGFFKDGLKHGKWKEYEMGSLSKVGQYKNGVKDGKWVEYISFGDSIGRIKSEYTYKDGIINGDSINYFFSNFVQTYENGNSGFRILNYPIFEKFTFVNGVLHGKYLKKNSEGKILEEGEYKDGELNGVWKELITEEGELKNFYFEGQMINSQRNGEWILYNTSNSVVRRYNFKFDRMDGSVDYFSSSGKHYFRKIYSNDTLLGFELIDTLRNNKVERFDIDISFNDILKKSIFINGKIQSEYTYKFTGFNPDSIKHEIFDSINFRNNSLCILHGSFSLFDSNGKVLSTGAYSDNKPSGVWLTYYASFKVKSELSYNNSTGYPILLFYKYDGDLYSGQLTDIVEQQGIQRVMQIKNGVLNGKCKTLDYKSGKVLKVEKYSKGVLVGSN